MMGAHLHSRGQHQEGSGRTGDAPRRRVLEGGDRPAAVEGEPQLWPKAVVAPLGSNGAQLEQHRLGVEGKRA